MQPLLSIAIATKDREQYCIKTIQSILSFKDDRIQITVADNSNTTKVKEFVDALASPQIAYLHDNSPISSIDNFNRAMEMTTGEYICLLGDDDGILPEAMDYLEWAKLNNIDSFCCKDTIPYFWPGAHPSYESGGLFVSKFTEGKKKVDAKKELVKLLEAGIVNYMFFDLPKSYHGFVKKDIMLEIKERSGNFYGALSPDIFSVVAIALSCKNHYIIDKPLTIAGVCRTSTTADQFKGLHSGELKDMPHLRNRKVPYIWDKDIPEFYSVTTIWGDSGLNSIDAMKMPEYRQYFNIYPLVAQALLMNRKQILNYMIEKCEKLRKEKKIGRLVFWSRVSFSVLGLVIDKGQRMYRDSFASKSVVIENVEDILQAFKLYNQTVNKS